jgi:hypothetical protein
MADLDVEEAYVEEVASRFLRLQDYLKSVGHK